MPVYTYTGANRRRNDGQRENDRNEQGRSADTTAATADQRQQDVGEGQGIQPSRPSAAA